MRGIVSDKKNMRVCYSVSSDDLACAIFGYVYEPRATLRKLHKRVVVKENNYLRWDSKINNHIRRVLSRLTKDIRAYTLGTTLFSYGTIPALFAWCHITDKHAESLFYIYEVVSYRGADVSLETDTLTNLI